jgi:hypothetical protein
LHLVESNKFFLCASIQAFQIYDFPSMLYHHIITTFFPLLPLLHTHPRTLAAPCSYIFLTFCTLSLHLPVNYNNITSLGHTSHHTHCNICSIPATTLTPISPISTSQHTLPVKCILHITPTVIHYTFSLHRLPLLQSP